MNYICKSAALASILSVCVAFAAVLAVIFGAVFIAALGCFLVFFPIALMVLPAVRRQAVKINGKLEELMKKDKEPDDVA